ncbi:hypothetical protein F2Q70_00039862 [Brassica cretica]|uniref:Uncharacterized protein n=1 Tax=Brassica cretica TaxID=69181 RepID=A0A8S9K6J9_BRACR|nr:hypothetical protein F2Q70_00039862 [Brassica cretica]
MDWLKSVKSFIFTVHLHVQGNDNHHEDTDSLQFASPPIHQRRRLFSTRYESRAQPSFPWISSNPSTDLMIPRRTKEKSMKPSSSSSSLLHLNPPPRRHVLGEEEALNALDSTVRLLSHSLSTFSLTHDSKI